MPKRESAPIQRAHVWLFADDIRWLNETYGHSIGMTKAVRTIVRGFRQRVEAQAAQAQDADPIPTTPVSLESIADDL